MLKVPRVIKNLHRWTRLSSQKWEDAWTERLRFLDPERVVMLTWPNSRALKIEVYCDEATSKRLIKSFGGRATKVAPEAFTGTPSAPRAPLAIRGKLKVYSDEASWREWKDAGRKPPGILIPAGMAFGTGEHATTATCLRFLADVAEELPEDFAALDLGAGSGILAVAAEALGAGAVSAIDYDPAAVRITRQNAKMNGCRRVKSAQGDALEFDERGQYDLVMANLFSEVLISVARASCGRSSARECSSSPAYCASRPRRSWPPLKREGFPNPGSSRAENGARASASRGKSKSSNLSDRQADTRAQKSRSSRNSGFLRD